VGLGVTQSSVSQSLAALEADVGEPLFVRAGRAVLLTETGRVLEAHARAVSRDLDATRRVLLDLKAHVGGRLSVGTSDTLATHLLPPVFARFRTDYPDIEFKLDNRPSPAIARRVASRELDVGVVSLPLPDERATAGLTQIPLLEQRDVVIVPRGHPLAGRARVRLSDLAGLPLVLLDETTAQRAWLEAHFRAEKIVPRVTMEMSSVEVIKRLVELGFGASVVPALAIDRRDRVVALPLAGLERARQVGLVVAPASSRGTRAFIELCRELLRRGTKGAREEQGDQPRARR
jgi:DNA-binding transcriptional LysR family regulator